MTGITRIFAELQDELSQIRNEYAAFRDDTAFVFWFLKAFLTNSDEAAREALTGLTGDKNIDALYIDDKAKQVHIVQGKYRVKRQSASEKPNDVMRFAALAELPHSSRAIRTEFLSNMDPHAAERFRDGIERLCVRATIFGSSTSRREGLALIWRRKRHIGFAKTEVNRISR
jgi:hypothetical protein